VPTTTPTAPTTPPGFDAKSMLGRLAHGFWTAVSNSPWLGVLLAVLVLAGAVRLVRSIVHGGHSKDIVRRFSQAERRIIFSRAGSRCEHHFLFFGRCRATNALEADHVHPHSRGGWTSVNNGQALCQRHNRKKSARVPWDWQLNRLAQRRAAYFLSHHDPVVVRHRPRTARASATPSPTANGKARRARARHH
jgi:hypothetical protein